MLKINQLSFHYPKHPLLNNINFTLEKGGLLTILGTNGAGKSTLLNCIGGLLKPQTGEILLNGKHISSMSAKQLAQHLAYVSQNPPQTYGYTVTDYIVLGCAARLNLFTAPKPEDYQLAQSALERLDIGHLTEKIYMQCSGGEKQLINIARVLVQQPQIILFDEPTAALDYGNVLKTLSLIKELSEQGFTIIMTSHTPDHPLLLHSRLPESQTAILDREGRLKTGNTADIITEENLNNLYGIKLRLTRIPDLNRKICTIARW